MRNASINSNGNKGSKAITPDNTAFWAADFWYRNRAPILLTMVGGAIDTISFMALLGFFTAHVTGNLVMAGGGLDGSSDGVWIKLVAVPLFIVTVMVTKKVIDRVADDKPILSQLLLAEALFLLAFMLSGLYFAPFTDAGSLSVALTGALGVIALAIRNTADKTLMTKMRPTVLMTGNTTQLGLDLANYLSDRSANNIKKVRHSASIVLSFTFGALSGAVLYLNLGFWAVAFFIAPVLYLMIEARDESLLTDID